MQAVILAAGRGTRLYPITASRTKAMCPVVGKPIVERVMEPLIANGIRDFVLVTHPEDEAIARHFRSSAQIDANVTLIPQKEQLGMGHALMQAAPLIYEDFVLSSCDNLVAESEIRRMLAIWEAEQPNGMLTLLKIGPEEIVRMGIVALSGDWVERIVEKPTLAEAPSNIGSVPLYLFSRRLIEYLPLIPASPRGEYELQDAIQVLIERAGRVRGMMLAGRMDLTLPADLLRINLHYLQNESHQAKECGALVRAGVRFSAPVWVEQGVTIGADCLIGPNVFLESGCTLGAGVRLENCVVLREAVVIDGAVIQNQLIW